MRFKRKSFRKRKGSYKGKRRGSQVVRIKTSRGGIRL